MLTTRIGPVLDAAEIRQGALQGHGSILGRTTVIGLCSLLVFGPMAFGAVEEWAVLILQLSSVALMLVWWYTQMRAGAVKVQTPLAVPMIVFGAVVLSQILLDATAYRYVTMQSGMLYAAYGVLCVLATCTLRDHTDDRNIWVILTAFGSLLAVFAIAQGLTASGKIYWVIDTHGGSPFGPYVNRNHYAGLMEMLLPIPLVMCMRRDLENGQRVVLGFGAALMALSVLMSQSRGGILSLAVELVLLGAAIAHSRNRRAALTMVLATAAAVALLIWVGMAGDVAQRMGTLSQPLQDSTGGSRLSILRDSLPMVKQKPLTGWGLGTFPTVYPRFRSFYTDLFVNQAHNDYLQMLVETGLVGFGSMLAFIVIVYRFGLRKWRHWQVKQSHALTLAALLGISGILVHSLLDFNLQIPANAALFYVLCGVAVRPPRSADRLFENVR